MAGLYRRGVQRNAADPRMQVAASQGAGGAIPRGGSASVPQQTTDDTSKKVQTLGGLLGMMNQQKQAQEDIAPGLAAAEQATANANSLPNPAQGVGFGSAPSKDGSWGGVQASSFGSGLPTSTGEFQLNSGLGNSLNLSATPSMQGVALPSAGAGQVPGAIANVGGNFMNAGQQATGAAMNAGKLATELQPQGMLDMLKDGWGAVTGFFGGGAGA